MRTGVECLLDGVEAEHGDNTLVVARHQCEPRRSHDRERAFTSTQERREVVAGVVLQESGQMGHHRSVGEDGFDAEHLRTCVAVAEHTDTARVGGDGSTDGRRVARCPVDAVVPTGAPSRSADG